MMMIMMVAVVVVVVIFVVIIIIITIIIIIDAPDVYNNSKNGINGLSNIHETKRITSTKLSRLNCQKTQLKFIQHQSSANTDKNASVSYTCDRIHSPLEILYRSLFVCLLVA